MYVSVIIPAFNAQKTIEYCINSCINQEGYVKEIIVVDDFSSDNTFLEVKKLKDSHPELIKLYSNPSKILVKEEIMQEILDSQKPLVSLFNG
jgi:glycosyltransferase involved in cell wall biosynthesis